MANGSIKGASSSNDFIRESGVTVAITPRAVKQQNVVWLNGMFQRVFTSSDLDTWVRLARVPEGYRRTGNLTFLFLNSTKNCLIVGRILDGYIEIAPNSDSVNFAAQNIAFDATYILD